MSTIRPIRMIYANIKLSFASLTVLQKKKVVDGVRLNGADDIELKPSIKQNAA